MKKKIPLALRQQVWIVYNGDRFFKKKCHVSWCSNTVTPFSFQVGHCTPESKGGTLDISNLRPICAMCNMSMADTYTIEEFSKLSRSNTSNLWECFRHKPPVDIGHQS